VRSVGVKRVAAGKEILKQDGREDGACTWCARAGAHRAHEDGTNIHWPRWDKATSSARKRA
jgi:hypothetical protein